MSKLMDKQEELRAYKDRLRIFVIIFFFSKDYRHSDNPSRKKVLESESKIQKIDFLLRYPDYLALKLLKHAKINSTDKKEVKKTVKEIFRNEEPKLKKLKMQRFFYGAYEDIDDVIAYLKGIGFIEFSSQKRSDLDTIDKYYYVTDLALDRVKKYASDFEYLDWYFERCKLIKKYFGDLSATELRNEQYDVEEYSHTSLKEYISGVEDKVKEEFKDLYGEEL